MSVDRLPDGGDDDRERGIETPRSTEPAPPETPPPPEASQPKEDLPATKTPEPPENAVQADDSPEASDAADTPPDPPEAPEHAEPRSRQEHADQPPTTDVAPSTAEQLERTSQEEAPPAKATPAETEDSVASDDAPASPHDPPAESQGSKVQDARSGEARGKPDEDTEYGEVPSQEAPPGESPDPQPARESTPREEANQKDFDDADEALDDEAATSNSAQQNHEAVKLNDEATPTDDQRGPLTDQEWTEHVVEVCEGLDNGRREGLISKRLHTIDGVGEIWTEERDRLHDSIIEDLYAKAAHVPSDFKAIIAGGLGGAGKTTVLTQYAGIELSHYLMINPDGMKEEMARRGMIPEIEGLSPMEASELVHEESSYLASQLALRAQSDGKNLIWDITMSREESVTKRINELGAAGYTDIEGVFVDIPVETSLRRTESRHREDHDKYLAGKGLGGRYVPPEVIESQKDQEWGSKNMRTFDANKHRFSNWSIYNNSVDWRRPVLIEASSKRRPNS